MARIEKPVGFKVVIIESERGWGQKVEDIIYFDNEPEAREFVTNYNKDLPPGPAPDWYMMAQYEGMVR